ncbi:MFS transporter [Sphingopyxis panaciterrae]
MIAHAAVAPRESWDSRAVVRLVLLCLILGSAWAARSVFNPLLDLAKADLSLSDLQLGLAQGAAMSLPAALLSIPLGLMVDRGRRTWLLLLLAALTMSGSIATAFSTSFTDLLAYRALTGLGMMEEAVVLSLIADLFPPGQRGRANMLVVLGEYGGWALGFAMASWLLPMSGYFSWFSPSGDWRIVPLLFGIAGMIFALPLALMREPLRTEREDSNPIAGVTHHYRALARFGPFLWPLLVAQAATATASNIASIWAVTVFVRRFGLQPAQAGELTAAAMSLPPLFGALIAGLMVDRLRASAGIVAVVASIVAIPAAFFPIASSAPATAFLLSVLMMSHTAAVLGSSTIGIIAIPNELRGLWFGTCAMFTIVIGFAIAPALVAWFGTNAQISDALPFSLAIALVCASTVAACGYLLSWRAMMRK